MTPGRKSSQNSNVPVPANMKVCGACGHELGRSCFSNTQWQQAMQKRRCKECVDKRTASTEAQEAGHGRTDDDRKPRPPAQLADGTATHAPANHPRDRQRKTRSAASAWMCTITRSSCRADTASVKSVSTAGIRSPSLTSISPGTARCAGIEQSHQQRS